MTRLATARVSYPQARLRFGVARRDITPPVGIYNRWWAASRRDSSTGNHLPLTATALAMAPLAADAGDDVIVLVALDLCTMGWPEQSVINERIRANPKTAGRVLCVYSHSHSAPAVQLDRVDREGGHLIPGYLEDLARAISSAAEEAIDDLAPATLVARAGTCRLAASRDFLDPEGRRVCGYAPDGDADDTLLVATVVGDDGRTRAIIANYACHPTTLAWDNTLVSPDYPGVARELVESRHPSTPFVFLQGASGDLGPRRGFEGALEVVEANGHELGFAVLQAVAQMSPPGVDYVYRGPVTSGTALGLWEYRPLDPASQATKTRWYVERAPVALHYRPDLPTPEALASEREALRGAMPGLADDDPRMAELVPKLEQVERVIRRLSYLPEGPTYPLDVAVWRTGDVVWVAVEDEHVQYLQRALRQRLDRPVFVMTLLDGGRVGYLPTADMYGTGAYVTDIAVLAPGSLERLVLEIAQRVERLDAAGAALAGDA